MTAAWRKSALCGETDPNAELMTHAVQGAAF
jgi:hypothetical protein